MHNNIMAAGSRDRPPMLATGRYAQWRSRFLRYIDTRPNGMPTEVHSQRSDSLILTWNCKMKKFILNCYVPCQTAQEMWEAIESYNKHQTLQDPYYQTSKPHKSYAPTSKASLPTRSHATTRYKGKEIAKPITPPSESASEEDSDPEQAQKDKDMQKNLALIAKYFKKLYKPTNNNLRTSSNTRNKNVDTTPRYKNDNQTGQFGNQRAVNVVGARETVGGPVVQQSGIQCFNCKEFGHYAKECRKPKRVKDSTHTRSEEIDEQELEAHYSYMAKIQEVPNADSGTDAEPLE
ncbi:retrovirus-related pol polyprotein from transposon TNT 1-94 [Tanacetum coccineum]|uniref:Retrovirus-related pol polyprotein from transposon TNT 1-94 n=1 Tax=Tanacetum coccineum TaxID=301880 RepID=A0ABQ5C6E7_9ASTR